MLSFYALSLAYLLLHEQRQQQNKDSNCISFSIPPEANKMFLSGSVASWRHSVSVGNPLWKRPVACLPRVCKKAINDDIYDFNAFYTMISKDIIDVGLNGVILAVMASNECKLIGKYRQMPTFSPIAHHIGAYAIRFSLENGVHPNLAFEILAPFPGRPLARAGGFLHGGMTQAMCYNRWPVEGMRVTLQPRDLLSILNISDAPTLFWYNALHGFGHALLSYEVSASYSFQYKDCRPIVHHTLNISDGQIARVSRSCDGFLLPQRNLAAVCVGGLIHTFIEWSIEDEVFSRRLYNWCLASDYPYVCLLRHLKEDVRPQQFHPEMCNSMGSEMLARSCIFATSAYAVRFTRVPLMEPLVWCRNLTGDVQEVRVSSGHVRQMRWLSCVHGLTFHWSGSLGPEKNASQTVQSCQRFDSVDIDLSSACRDRSLLGRSVTVPLASLLIFDPSVFTANE